MLIRTQISAAVFAGLALFAGVTASPASAHWFESGHNSHHYGWHHRHSYRHYPWSHRSNDSQQSDSDSSY